MGNNHGFSTGNVQAITPPPPPAPVQHAPAKPLRVGGEVMEARIIKRVMPVYPEIAKRSRVSGRVRLMSVIAADGTIQKLQVTEGHPLLVAAALEAVRQWVYKPTLLNGQPVEVQAPIEVIFTLAQ
jgi:protein TonB